ncbi:probable galactinol--sucrose galactosyltransferase 1 isoform X1 [Sorghum bicolor]|uniref:probable galactinol--sucrose galactosyltransferase 1 isoform X1 n=1 Tax=Sorghum bicolor TaxID=4558 RepID=UPI000B423F11|nr:probable galactinol--sucrose galactosyltransferase 1 isoform X1 [Sorghum bicolor]|eukprot:XP_021319923.1 probable galactinol--sucrose galactosyltransferase 1 isoform X1 [Sorghum bicolor]
MTVGAGIAVQDGSLLALGAKVLREVRPNVLVTPAAGGGLTNGAFLGVRSAPAGSRSVFPVGKLRDQRFMCTFRFKMWWMTQRMGSSGRDIPFETQFLIVEGTDGLQSTGDGTGEQPVVYTIFLPILEGSFRAVLQGNADDELEICLESGDPDVESFEGSHLVFVGAGSDPFEVITNSVKVVERHLQTFSHREKKKMPDMLNWFGWCTWDAFYTNVTAQGVKKGLQSFEKGGVSPRFVIIDDGWQSVAMDPVGIACLSDNSANFANRLTHIKENHKFQKNGREGHREDDPAKGLAHIVNEIKGKHELKYGTMTLDKLFLYIRLLQILKVVSLTCVKQLRYVYVWHAITGYWGGVRPGVAGMEHYESKMQQPVSSPGVQKNEPCDALDSITTNGMGLVNPEKVFSFYNELHSYLASAGIDGVKVDVQNILETLGAGHGGRVLLARKYQQALEASVARNFPDNGIISCMSHNTDNLYSSKRSAVIRASDDFWPRDPASHTIHIASVAYNTVFLGEFMQPDWDMFHSVHPMAEYHAAARAVGGCAIYVSDKPGNHDFNLLKKLVLPDGSILRAKLPGRPTRDCLFSDPARDGKSILKIWNLNEHSGVIGAFNCQGAGWCQVGKKNLIHDEQPGTVTGVIRAQDVGYLAKVADQSWNGDVIVYSHVGGEVVYLPKNASLPVTLRSREYEVFTVVPLKHLPNGVSFAPIGLVGMFNSGGAVREVRFSEDADVELKVRGSGTVGAYSSTRPRSVTIDSKAVGFCYDDACGQLTFELGLSEQELYFWTVSVGY